MENKSNLTASVTRHNITAEDVDSFVKNSIVKFIFLDEEYKDISSDSSVTEIHKFKSKYRGNTYIRVPLKIVKGEYDKYVKGIEVDTSDNPQGFAVVSKHDLRDLTKEMKTAKKAERVEFGEKLCKKYLHTLNKFLSNNILKVVVRDVDNNVITEKLICGGRDFTTINKEVNSIIENIK